MFVQLIEGRDHICRPEKSSDVDQMVNVYTMYATRQNISLKLRQTNAIEEERITRDWPEINWPRLAVKQRLQVGGRRLSITLLIIGGLHGSVPLVPGLHSLPQDKGKIFRWILTFSTKQCVALREVAKVYGAKLTCYPLCTKFFFFDVLVWLQSSGFCSRTRSDVLRDLSAEISSMVGRICTLAISCVTGGSCFHNY